MWKHAGINEKTWHLTSSASRVRFKITWNLFLLMIYFCTANYHVYTEWRWSSTTRSLCLRLTFEGWLNFSSFREEDSFLSSNRLTHCIYIWTRWWAAFIFNETTINKKVNAEKRSCSSNSSFLFLYNMVSFFYKFYCRPVYCCFNKH